MSMGYVIKEGFVGFRRTKLATFTSVTALMLAVIMLSMLGRFAFSTYTLAQSIRTSIDVEVFLLDIDDRRTNAIQSDIREFEFVDHIEYISKDSAAVIFREEFGSEGGGLADLNFLPASIRVSFTEEAEVADISGLVSYIQDMRGVDEVIFNRALLELLEERMELLVLAGAGIGLIILLTAVVLVFNTIRLTIYAKRNLIRAMKLVGATNGFVRRPFVFEGILQGLLAAIIALVVHWLIFHVMIPTYIPQFGVLAWPFGRWYYLTGASILLAIIMGWMGSRWAARKFIKETTISA